MRAPPESRHDLFYNRYTRAQPEKLNSEALVKGINSVCGINFNPTNGAKIYVRPKPELNKQLQASKKDG